MSEVKRATWIDYLRVMRLDHWLKNIFVLFGHAVAIELLRIPITPPLIGTILLSLIPVCFIASANYIVNEILDAPFDRVHPTKRARPVAAGTVRISFLWLIFTLLCAVAFGMAAIFFNIGYIISLLLLLASGVLYNLPPIRLKDRAFLDVIAESFNNPVRLWLGWYAIAASDTFPPLSLVLAWWFFGALLMAGKRYAEYRFIGDAVVSGHYRRSFRTYDERLLIISMITYANFFCFCMGVAIAHYRPNLLFVFPIVVLAIIFYFNHAMTRAGAKLEPEQLLRNPWVITCTITTVVLATWLVWTDEDLPERFRFLELIDGQ